MSSVLFLGLLVSVLLLPGFAVTKMKLLARLGFPEAWRFLISLSLSYSIYIFIFIVKSNTHYSWATFDTVIYAVLIISAVFLLIDFLSFDSLPAFVRSKELLGFLLILIVVLIYHSVVGPYDELPADIYAHLGRYQKELANQSLDSIRFSSLSVSDLIMQKSDIWYKLVAQCSRITGVSASQVVYLTTMVTKALFMLSVYSFSLCIFFKEKRKVPIALIATLFVFLHMGINVMSYARYYSFAPTILAYCIYLSAIVCFAKLLESKDIKQCFMLLFLMSVLTFTASTIHTQEALFIVVMTISMAFVVMMRSVFKKSCFSREVMFSGLVSDNSAVQYSSYGKTLSIIYVLAAGVGLLIIYWYAQNHLEQAPNVAWRLWEFNFFGWEVRTLNMKNQFLQVITLWGVSVYIFSVIYSRYIKHNIFLLAGLVSPALSLMNPFFVDVFLSIQDSTVLWRMAYIIPVHFAAALILVSFIDECRAKKNVFSGLVPLVVFCVVLIVFLMPVYNTKFNIHYSRIPTLLKTDVNIGADRYFDLIEMLSGVETPKEVLTDPVTGYALEALTKHTSKRHKFFPVDMIKINYDSYLDKPLEKHAGKFIVVNLRLGYESEVGRLSGHWSADVLDTGAYYKESLLQHLKSNPDRFGLLWNSYSGDIKVYEINF